MKFHWDREIAHAFGHRWPSESLSDQVIGGNVSASEAPLCVWLGTWVLLDKVLAPG